ncbi:hypothetical protein DFJ74DRAFT_650602 [Hyaloraphidium curvatum]|nr:hypothetical protein DFJ74DRAFT_650602 [Hyaloraphidium curvatum]
MHAQRVRYAGQLANRQSASLKACLRELAGRARWIAFLDVDEFLVPPPGRTVLEELARFDDKPGLFLPWRILGPGPNSSEPDVEHLPLHRVLNAADDSGTNMLNLLGKGKLLLRAAHPGAARACEHFMNLKPGHSASLTINYVHNCLAWSGMLPVDPQGREAGDPLMAPIPIRKTGLKLFHYFARSCADFEARRPTRLSYYRTLHGTDPEPGGWFRGRTGDRLGNTTAERCAALRRHFSEEERGALAHLGLLAQERARVSSAPVPPLLPRAECGRCDPKATCVDLLGTAECVCEARYEGNGRFCGDMVWAGNVLPKIGHWEKESARGPEGTLHVPSGEGWNGTVVLDFGEARLARAVRLYLQDGACGVTDVAVRGLSLREWEELAVPGADRGKVCVPNGEIEVEVRLLAPAAVARVRVGVRQGSVLAAAGLLVEA